ncbi:lipopolysaccharide transport periplasmic protein LptA [Gilvimarinus agarilyticus]|uniref:lipopolysaccharide transport periplasmic protein LptA n=1 Tax=unclassified Gilvimarinus TaxID=2642066 RepID=UPI001C08E541|nr:MULTISPECIES: lipopolysaccharide transport periplasmic protein LptA [unclassified Gilvimarinus]MBU2885443.1 lipopolysaccharide transport periplasmic protein LptA [Gilvimarinus agarilyticus]MDO6570343.1 lipopolysaccharide transport periplasmic protein LptA [Gilvimarinus sp. 2_MG-2023]MDO6746870.1 lipopolysaccharide transport periplasmic protein LptA [Gilvimarinus sp. 1_MG-2023]
MLPTKRLPAKLKHCVLTVLLAIVSTTAFGLPSDREQNFELQANQQTFDQKNGRVTYTGEARLQQGSLIIRANTIVVQFDQDNSVEQITAEGSPAHFEQQPSIDRGVVSAKAGIITYNSANNTVSLSKGALLEQDGAVMQGHEIRYDINRELVSAEGDHESDQPIQMTIPPALIEQ